VAHKLVRVWLRLLVAGACGIPLEVRIVARDALLVLQPLRQAVAEAVLDDLLDVWAQGMLQPLPVACRTALAWLAAREHHPDKAEDAACTVYEGGHTHRGEVQDPALARCFPDGAALLAGHDFDQWAQRLYEPLRLWAADRQQVQVLPLPDAAPGADDDDEDPRDD
jgi:exodeoxyribonuclease V gamma subunit